MGQEIVTLQFGQCSNSIGLQYWAQQEASRAVSEQKQTRREPEEFCRERLFRGTDLSEPRALIFDLKGTYDVALSNKFEGDGLFNEDLWRNQPQLLLPERSLSEIRWSDSDRTVYNSKTPHMVSAFQQNHQAGQKFQSYFDGRELFKSFEKENESIDTSLRFFTEESDSLQGFQVFADLFGGFSGFSTSFLEAVKEEYPKTPILLFGTMAHPIAAPSEFSIVDQALCLTETAKLECTSIGLQPNLAIKSLFQNEKLSAEDSLHAAGSAFSVAIDAALSASRALRGHLSLETIRQTLNTRGSTFHSELSACFVPLDSELSKPDLSHLSYVPQEDVQVFGSFTTSRGCPPEFLSDKRECEMSHKSAIYNSLFSQLPWQDSYRFPNHEIPFGSIASLKTTSLPFEIFRNFSSQTKRFFAGPSLLSNCPDLQDLKQSLPYELIDLSENYAKY